jgi:phosphate transport system permease protein
MATAVEVLAAIPSIIYRMWGLFVLAPVIATHVQPWLTKHLVHSVVSGRRRARHADGVAFRVDGHPHHGVVARLTMVPTPMKEAASGLATLGMLRSVVLPYTRSDWWGQWCWVGAGVTKPWR